MRNKDRTIEELTEELNLLRGRLAKTEQYRDFFENANDAIFLVDADRSYIDVNRKAAELLGYSREELLAMNILDLIPDDQKQRSLAEFVKLKKEGQYEKFRGRMRTRNGRWLDIEVSSSAIFDGDTYLGSQDIVRDITDEVRTAKALQESEARLKEAQRMAHIGNWAWDTGTNRVEWSDELYRIYGYEPGAIAPDYELIVKTMHPHDREEFLAAVDAALERDTPFEMDYAFFRKDGSPAVLHTIGRVIRDARGRPVRMEGTVQDVSVWKHAEETLRESEEKFRGIFDAANDGILIVQNATGKIIEANRTFCAMLGYTREEITALSIRDIHPAADLPMILDEFEKQRKRERTVNLNIPVLKKDGTVFYVDISTTSMHLHGEACSIGIFRDITDRKRAEEALRNSERFIRNILDTVDEGFIVVDRDFRIVTANRAYCDQVGAAGDEVIGRNCHAVSHRRSTRCYEAGEECAVRRVFETGEGYTVTHRHTDGKGCMKYVETKAFPIRDAAGAITSVIETVNNITEKHLLEEERLKTQKLEAIGTLAGGIAHDFNNLLQGVFGYISMAKISLDSRERALSMLEQAEQALHLSVNLTKQLLTFSKGGKPVKKVIPLGPVIENSVKFALSGSRVDYHIVMDEDLRAVEADEGQIGQVIQNVVINADQAMPLGGTIRISAKNVRTARKGEPNLPGEVKYVEIAVQDTGIGIAEPYLQRVFDPYFTTKEKGSGLGLATAYSIVKSHGGVIDVTSEAGRGSTFFVCLPVADVDKDASSVPAAPPAGRKGKILFMDDEELIRNIAGEMIRTDGHHVEFVEHGEAAIEKYRSARESGTPFDVVILDLTIRGGMGGKETIRQLLEIDPGVKAIVSSGYSDDTVVADYRDFGFSGCLTKPYQFDTLKRTLNELLRDGARPDNSPALL